MTAIDTTNFDTLVRVITASTSRRVTLRGLAVGTTVLTGAALVHPDEVRARQN